MDLKESLLKCKTYAEAKPILEIAGITSPSVHELARTAFSVMAKQPTVAQHFLQTIVQETDGGTSHQASSTDGLTTVGSEEVVGDVKEQPNAKDQMGVPIGEMQPMGMGGFPPMQPQSNCGNNMQQQPPRPPMNPQQQIQYMIHEAIKTEVAPFINKLQESVKTLDKKIMETTKPIVNELDLSDRLGGKGSPSKKMFIQETTGNNEVDLETARSNIKKINDAMNTGIY